MPLLAVNALLPLRGLYFHITLLERLFDRRIWLSHRPGIRRSSFVNRKAAEVSEYLTAGLICGLICHVDRERPPRRRLCPLLFSNSAWVLQHHTDNLTGAQQVWTYVCGRRARNYVHFLSPSLPLFHLSQMKTMPNHGLLLAVCCSNSTSCYKLIHTLVSMLC